MYEAPFVLIAAKIEALTAKPVETVVTEPRVADSAAVLLSNKYGSVNVVMPRAVSYTYKLQVLSVRLIKTNLAPPVNPQLMV